MSVALLLLLAGCGDGASDEADGDNQSGTEQVISWDEHDLREWVTDDEMVDALTDMAAQYSGTELEGELHFEHDGEDAIWRFRLTDGTEWDVTAHDGDHEGRTEDLRLTNTDPRLPQGVVYEPGIGFAYGFYILSGPNSDESVCMIVVPPSNLRTSDGRELSEQELSAHEDRVFAVASVMLREMGWVD